MVYEYTVTVEIDEKTDNFQQIEEKIIKNFREGAQSLTTGSLPPVTSRL